MKFYGPGDVLIAELGPEEGIAIPGGARYWFEKTGHVDLELLQCVSFDSAGGTPERVNVDAHKDWMTEAELASLRNQRCDVTSRYGPRPH